MATAHHVSPVVHQVAIPHVSAPALSPESAYVHGVITPKHAKNRPKTQYLTILFISKYNNIKPTL